MNTKKYALEDMSVEQLLSMGYDPITYAPIETDGLHYGNIDEITDCFYNLSFKEITNEIL